MNPPFFGSKVCSMLKELQTLCQIPLTAGKQSQNAAGKSVCAKTIYTPEGNCGVESLPTYRHVPKCWLIEMQDHLSALDSTFSGAAAG
jgi:hypothetical protein